MSAELIPVYIMGKKHYVPETATILNAFEYAGYQVIRGCGCRGGFCGACATFYRFKDDYKLHVGLACQKVVEPNMYLTQLPFFPANKSLYDMDALEATAQQIIELYPEMMKCMGCNTCAKVCPQELEPMEYVAAAMRGDIKAAAEKSFDCIMCGLCASRCPGELVQYNIGMLARRLYSRYVAPNAQHLASRVLEIRDGKFNDDLEELKSMPKEKLQKVYEERDIEE